MLQEANYIRSFLKTVEQLKGVTGAVELHLVHWMPGGGERGVICRDAAALSAAGPKAKPAPQGTTGEPPIMQRDGALRVGEYVEVEGGVPCGGYLHLFNFGTSGTCLKLAPSAEFPDNAVRAGQVFHIPSDQFLARAALPEWREMGPLTAETGHREYLFAVLTADDVDLQLKDLHAKLQGRDLLSRSPSRGPSFHGQVSPNRPKLFCLDKDRWEYGLVTADVVAA